jgi:hypothetical protein
MTTKMKKPTKIGRRNQKFRPSKTLTHPKPSMKSQKQASISLKFKNKNPTHSFNQIDSADFLHKVRAERILATSFTQSL